MFWRFRKAFKDEKNLTFLSERCIVDYNATTIQPCIADSLITKMSMIRLHTIDAEVKDIIMESVA